MSYNIPGNQKPLEHEWTTPPPGSGPLLVCKHCAVRKTAVAGSFECRRDKYESSPVNNIDYDPIP
jgi:hypothetical protein